MFSPRLNHQSSYENLHSPPLTPFFFHQTGFRPSGRVPELHPEFAPFFLHSPWPRASEINNHHFFFFFRAVDVSKGGGGGATKTTQHQKLSSAGRELPHPSPPPAIKGGPEESFRTRKLAAGVESARESLKSANF